jgi:ATP-dependent RNA helicase SUPV3L1/SUV3
MLEQLVPTAAIRSHPRLSTLKSVAPHTLAALPARSALIAFSAPEVYELADRVRRQRGGAAVVLGALSPRTRNAQVAMYQAGEVDTLVATDAIGMGLNLDVDHVAFVEVTKFDGRRTRALSPAELGQIAGRAGRHTSDGSFGTLAPLRLDSAVAFAIESHRFAPVRRVVWRNADLDFTSLDELIVSLKQRPTRRCLQLVERADDLGALLQLASRPDIRARAQGAERVALLWEVCRIPDFRKVLVEHHASLLAEIFKQLTSAAARLDPDWVDERVRRLEDVGGNIDDLMMRMESVRIWNFVAHRARWLDDARHWQQRTQAAEDRLSEALHERLVERFVDARGQRSRHRARARPRRRPSAARAGQASVPGDSPFRKLLELDLAFGPQPASPGRRDGEHDPWVGDLVEATHESFRVDAAGSVYCHTGRIDGARPVARLTRGVDLHHPEVKVVLDRDPGAGGRARIQRRLVAFTRDLVAEALAPLRNERVERLSPAGRGLVYQLEQGLGTAQALRARQQLEQLTEADRHELQALGVHLGRRFVYVASLLKPAAVQRRAALCAASLGSRARLERLAPAAVSLRRQAEIGQAVYLALGFPVLGPRAVRADVAERADARLRAAARESPFELPSQLSSWLGCSRRQVSAVVRALGYERARQGWQPAAEAHLQP